MKKLYYLLASLLFYVCAYSQTSKTDNNISKESQIKKINEVTFKLTTQIDSNLLFPFIENTINYGDAKEGVPPEAQFYFDREKRLYSENAYQLS